MKFSFLCILPVLLIVSCTAQAQKVTPVSPGHSLQLLSYGLQRPARQEARNRVADGYGFSYKTVAGCVVTKALVDSVRKINSAVKATLEERYGKDFWNRFENEVKEETQRQRELEELVQSLPYIKNKKQAMEKQGEGLYFFFQRSPDKSRYLVIAHGPGAMQNGQWKVPGYYQLEVDATHKKVKLLSDREEGLVITQTN